eukprot:gnl/MRDRNA2_/MRDRNA2_94252_c0_seq1.p1 gnl/MRDRNA2_/MRDRNA2_94252_c0~~gnl/MRDRNA2_/MRDRNA2_94252_c0_seq1.p1  ORF type:complete len:211 (+),score=38.04 gnl/MRDRNA2_/MRDRNA2_94252_c0_seq1:112-744(+)
MAFRAARGIARSLTGITRTTPSMMPAARMRPGMMHPGIGGLVCSRSLVTAAKFSRSEMVEKIDNFHDTVLCTNWADYLTLVYDVPFWEAEFEKIQQAATPYLQDPEIGEKMTQIGQMMDVFYACEDCRDHINELLELCTRASGLMGTGYGAGEKVENLDDHAMLAGEQYDKLLAKYPAYKPKIEQTVGHGLALLRQKHKFKFTSMHRYFF